LRELAKRYGINQKTVAKWRRRASGSDLPTGPREPKSTVQTVEDEAIIVAFRQHTLLPLDDCLYSLQATIPHLTRSSLHRCLQRHAISRLPDVQGDKPAKKKFKSVAAIGASRKATAVGRSACSCNCTNRTSRFCRCRRTGGACLPRSALRRCRCGNNRSDRPYRLHTILTDNGIHFADLPRNRNGWTARFRVHRFDQICRELGIEHRLAKPNHPWTNDQVERMNRTIKDATVKRYHYDDHDQLSVHLRNFVDAYNFARRLKTLKGLTPCEFICKSWTSDPKRFNLDPRHQMPGSNT
jgi:transposase InsO family protein